jgi:ribulose-phosphate 3-epimerase
MYVLAPSILSADFKNLGSAVETVAAAGAEYIHIDVMDGMFVPSISYGMPVIKSIRSCTDKVFDVHMMVEEPGRYAADMKAAGADLICVHQEACRHLDRTVNQIKELGLKAAVALNPATPVSTLDPILPQLDMVLIMSVNPGFGGQKFIPYTLDKVRELRTKIDALGLKTDIEIDGGVGLGNLKEVLDAGANIIVAGSAVYNGNASENVKKFLDVFQTYEK